MISGTLLKNIKCKLRRLRRSNLLNLEKRQYRVNQKKAHLIFNLKRKKLSIIHNKSTRPRLKIPISAMETL